MKVAKRKGTFVQYEDGTWGIDTKVKVNDAFKHFSKKGYPTLSSVKADYDRARAEFVSLKSAAKCEVIIFDDFLIEYEKMRKVVVNETTAESDKSTFQVYFLPQFKGKLIKDCFNRDSIKNWYDALVNDTSKTNNKKSKTISRMKDLLKFAYMHKYIDAPTYQDCDVCLYQVKYSKKPITERVIWTSEEETKFWKAITNKRDYVMFKTFFSCGARIGEFMGLQPKSIDFEKKRLTINQQALYISGKGIVLTNKLKTNESYRSVLLTDEVINLLKDYIETLSIKDNEFLFFESDRTKPISRTSFRRKLYHYCDVAGVRKINPHSSRHLQAVKLCSVIKTGEEIEAAAKRLGHSPEMFMNTYASHSKEKTENDLLERIKI